MGSHQYSEEFKKAAVQKFLSRGLRPASLIVKETGASIHSLYQWSRQYGNGSGMKKSERRPESWSPSEKFKAELEFEGLPLEKRGEFLRSQGLHSEHIEAWSKSMQTGLEPATRSTSERAELSELKAEVKELKRDLHRKDRALAETTALLVLKKKADLIWGTGENE